jgi:hypothetical protein
MVRDGGAAPFHAKRPCLFRFRVEDGAGEPAGNTEQPMGTLGKAALAPATVGKPRTGHMNIACGLPAGVFDTRVEK